MRKPRILFSLEAYPPFVAGSGIATQNIARGLAKRGYKTAVMCPGEHATFAKSNEEGVEVYRVGSFKLPFHKDFRFAPFAGAFAGKIFEEFKPGIIHLADHFSTSIAAFSEAQRRNIVAVGTNHFHPDNLIHHLKIERDSDFYRFLEKYMWEIFAGLYNSLSAITVPTRTGEAIIKKAGITRPVRVISNGIDLKKFQRRTKGENFKNNRKGTPVILSVGRLEKEKRPDITIKTFHKLLQSKPSVLVFAGKGDMEKELRRLAAQYGISDSIVFAGFVPDDKLRNLYESADVFISSSEVEMQGLSILEAMAYGIPVVASGAMAIPELVINGKNGFIFRQGDYNKAADAIATILNDRELKNSMSKSCLKMAGCHNLEKTLDEFEDFYEQQIKSSRIAIPFKTRMIVGIFHRLSLILIAAGVIIVGFLILVFR